MDNLRRFVAVCFCILIVCMTVLFVQIHKLIELTKTEIVEVRDSIEKISYDTIFVDRPIVYKQEVLKYDTVRINTVSGDSTDVILPVIRKEYRDSTYEAYVSGYKDVNLDSIRVFLHNKIIEINNLVTQYKYKNKHWHIGPSVGVGYDFTNNRVAPYLGVSVQYSIFSW